MAKATVEKNSLPGLEDYSSVLKAVRADFQVLVNQLKRHKELSQSLEFAVLKVEAELESLEATVKEIEEPSVAQGALERQPLLKASIGKLLPYLLLNFERLRLQCGVESPGGDLKLTKALFEKNPEFSELLLTESVNG